jgi:chromosome partitioning protein
LAHALADTLVTPLNDSFVDLDLLGEVAPNTYQVKRLSHYSELVWESRKFRSASGKPPMDWLVTRNRLAPLDSHNNKRVHAALEALQHRVKFRYVPGLNERVIYRELFPQGLTVLDLGKLNSASHVTARKEVHALVDQLNLADKIPGLFDIPAVLSQKETATPKAPTQSNLEFLFS